MTTKKHDVPEELLSGLLANYKKPKDLISENGLLKQLTKLLVELTCPPFSVALGWASNPSTHLSAVRKATAWPRVS